MKIGFGWLWWIWAIGVSYDLTVVALGIFPDRSLSERIGDEFRIAWFIFSAWLIWRLAHLGSPPENEENAA